MIEIALAILALIFLFTLFYTYYVQALPSRMPPQIGLRLPIIGHMHLVGKEIFTARGVKDLYDKFGPITTCFFGAEPYIIVHTYELAKEILIKNGSNFTDRSMGWFSKDLNGARGILASNGISWLHHRRFALHVLRDLGMGKMNLEESINVEVKRLTDAIDEKNGKPFDPTKWTAHAITNVIGAIVDGKTYSLDHPAIRRRLDYIQTLLSVNAMADGLGFLEHLPLIDLLGQKRARRAQKKMFEVYREEIASHRSELDPDNIRDFIDAYLVEINKGDPASTMCDEELYQTIDDLYLAGTHTTSTTINWAFLYIASQPETQEKVRNEIHEVLGMYQMPSTRHRTQLPYMDATLLETQRLASILALSEGNVASNDIEIGDYQIPKGSVMSFALSNILMDPVVFDEPDKFKPERYISDNGKVTKPEQHIPFLIGKRSCPGESLARMEIFLFITRVLQRYRLKLPVPYPTDSEGRFVTNEEFVRGPMPYLLQAEPLF